MYVHMAQVRMGDMFLTIQKKTKNDGDTITLDKNVWMEMLEDVNQSLWKKKRRETVKWKERKKRKGKNKNESAVREKRELYRWFVRGKGVHVKDSAEVLQELNFIYIMKSSI